MRKGQAATEFLFTYGWAIMVVLIMITGLAYLGILDFGKLLPDKCFFGAGISCKDQNYQPLPAGHTNVSAILVNTFGMPIETGSVVIEDDTSGCTCTPSCGIENQEWSVRGEKLLKMDCATPQDRINIKVKIKYRLADGQYDRVVEGIIQTRS